MERESRRYKHLSERNVGIWRGLLVCCGSFAVMAVCVHATATGVHADFQVERVDTFGSVGTYSSIAVDAAGSPHIAYRYYVPNQGDLKYASKAAGLWSVSTVRGTADNDGYGISLALSTFGQPCISYGGAVFVFYIRREGSAWINSYVGNAAQLWGSTSLMLDSEDQAHIVYPANQIEAGFELMYAAEESAAFAQQPVASVGVSPSAQREAGGRVHISCVNNSTGALTYVLQSGSSWVFEAVDPLGGSSSLALDSGAAPAITYQAGWEGPLKFARRSGGVWTIEVVDATSNSGEWCDLALDDFGNPHISYYSGASGDLKYATRSAGAWYSQTIDFAGDVGTTNSIAVDGQGFVHVSYYDSSNKDLKYAISQYATGVPERARHAIRLTVAPNPVSASGTSITYQSPSGGTFDLAIFDITGRRVSTLLEGSSSLKDGTVSWSGRDDAGRSVATGTYFLRFASGDENETLRITLVK